MTQLEIWRIQAFQQLEDLLSKAKTEPVSKLDELLDHLIRVLSNLPARPADRPPYMGIYGTANVVTGRQKSAERLKTLVGKLQGVLNSTDHLVDDLLRLAANLPPRPPSRAPYEGLFPPSQMQWLQVSHLRSIAPTTSSERIAALLSPLNQTMVEYDIDTPLRQAHFLAQVAHESDRFNALEEYRSGAEYEGRDDLGNINPGDGIRFKGRGLIQVTGRANYQRCGLALGVDLIRHPHRLAELDLACRSAGWYWDTNNLNTYADRDDVQLVTRIVNGALNGLQDRINLLAAAKQSLKLG